MHPLITLHLDTRNQTLLSDILLNSEQVDALSALVHRSNAYTLGKNLLKIERTYTKTTIWNSYQAAIGSKIIARETIKALRKDVTAKCYGGDITEKENF